MLLASGQMGVFNLEGHGFFLFDSCPNASFVKGFSVSRKPVFGIALNVNTAKRIRIFSAGAPGCRIVCALSSKEPDNCTISSKFLEREFKFEPAFDEYLKVMESVADIEVSNLSRGTEGYLTKKNLVREDNCDKNAQCGPKRVSRVVKNVDTVERGEVCIDEKIDNWNRNIHGPDELPESGRGGTHQVSSKGSLAYEGRERDLGDGFLEKRQLGTNQISGKVKLGNRQRERNLKENRGLRSHRKLDGARGGGVDEELDRRKPGYFGGGYSEVQGKGKWMKGELTSVGKKMCELSINKSAEDVRRKGHHRQLDVVGSSESNGYSREGEHCYTEDTSEMRKKQLQQNSTWAKGRIGNAERKMGEYGINKVMLQKKNVFSTKDEKKINESVVNKGILGSKSSYRSDAETDVDEFRVKNYISERASFICSMDKGNRDRVVRDSDEIESNDDDNEMYADEMEVKTVSHGEVVPRWDSHYGEKEIHAQQRNPRQVWLRDDVVGARKVGLTNTEVHRNLSREYVQATNNGKVIGPYHISMEDDHCNELRMERKAFESFEEFTDVRNRPRVLRMEMEERIKKLAKWLNGTDVNLPEWQFSKMIHSAKIKFTDHSILRIIQILGALGNWRRALQVVEWLQSRDRFKSYKSKYIYTTVLDVLGKARRPVEALNVFHAMRQQLSSYPDLAAYHCIAVTLGQVGHMKELFDVIDSMRALPEKKFKLGMLEKWDPRLEPDLIVYHAVLNACVRRKQWEGAFWVLQQLKQQKMPPSSTTYGLVMEVMFTCGKYSLVHEFFWKVEKISIPNALNYKVLVNTLWREGKTDEAVLVVQDMERRGIVGSASLYYDLARCLCSAGRCQEALQQIDKICKVAKKPLVVTYTGLIQACLESGNVQSGAYMFDQMRRFCSPNIVTCNIVLKAYIENNMFKEAKDLFHKLLDGTDHVICEPNARERVLPDNFTFNTLLEACVDEKRWEDFGSIYRQMLHHGHHFNPKRHLRMILEASRAGKGQTLDATWDHLVQSGRSLPLPMIKERFCAKLQEGRVSEAISCICTHQLSDTFSEKVWLDLFNGNAYRFAEETLLRLVDELNTLITERDGLESTFWNLVSACRKFIRTHAKVAASGPPEIS